MKLTINDEEITLTSEQIKQVVEHYQKNGTPQLEAEFASMLNGCIIRIETKRPQSVFFDKDGRTFFEHDNKNKRFWIDMELVWRIFDKKFSCEWEDFSDALDNVLERQFGLSGFRVDHYASNNWKYWKSKKETL